MSKTKSFDFDKLIIGMAVLYIVVPIVIFLFGWTKWYIAIPAVAVMVYLSWQVINSVEEVSLVSIKKNGQFWLISFGVIVLWMLFSGIGGFAYQTGDFAGRNPMYRDVYLYDWPVIYDLSLEPENIIPYFNGSPTAMYVYYFVYWLPIAGLTKIFAMFVSNPSMIEFFADVVLFIWSTLGICLIYYCLVRVLKRYSYWILAALMLFGGLDFVIYVISNMSFPVNAHIEYWNAYYQYVSNSNQIYWAFNQTIPVWMVIGVMLLLKNNKAIVGWTSLAVAHSPLPTIGLVPIAIAAVFNREHGGIKKNFGKNFKECITVANILSFVVMLIFVTFYTQIMESAQDEVKVFDLYRSVSTVAYYSIFVLVEFLLYVLIMGKQAWGYRFYWVVLAELLILPNFHYGSFNESTMRISIPALFILMVMCLKFILEREKTDTRRRVLCVVMVIGFLTAGTELQRNISLTLATTQPNVKYEDFYSFGDMRTDEEWMIIDNITKKMALEENYKSSFFGKYICK